ncbi:MAG: hypothetical protein NTY03_02580 [Candidatus Bathyarchaeota archaeon]|nr:hypothetical protein [Candidatus Bathyarchaeota archaeon]
MKLFTLCIIAAAITVGGSAAIIYYANANTSTFTVTTQVHGGNGIIIGAPFVDLNYDQGYGLTLKVNGGGSLKLTVIPDPGYKFSSWGGDLQGSVNPVTVVVNKDLFITAILVPG